MRLWDPETGHHERTLTGHTLAVNGVCPVTVGGRTLLASASNDGTVRLRDPATDAHSLSIPVPSAATCCAAIGSVLFIGQVAGITAIALDPSALPNSDSDIG